MEITVDVRVRHKAARSNAGEFIKRDWKILSEKLEEVITHALTEAICKEFGIDEMDLAINVKPTIRIPY